LVAEDEALKHGLAFLQAGKPELALPLFQEVLRRQPKHVAALNLVGIVLMQNGRFAEAEGYLRRALDEHPRSDATLHNYGLILKALNRPTEALDRFTQALQLNSGAAETWNDRGALLHDLKRHEEAVKDFDKAIQLRPRYPEAFYNKARSLTALRHHAEAISAFDQALALKPDFAEAMIGRAFGFFELKKYAEALATFEKALAFKAGLAEIWFGRGNVFTEIGRYGEALSAYDKALALQPDLVEAWLGRSRVFFQTERYGEAISTYREALALRPDPVLWRNFGDLLSLLVRYSDAFVAYDKSATLQPDSNPAVGARLFSKLRICDWTNLEAEVAQLISTIKEGKASSTPMSLFGIPASPAEQLQCARRYLQDQPAYPPVWRGEVYVHDHIRVAYVSPDLREHPVAYLTAGLFERHDKTRFETTAISLGRENDSDFYRRIKSSFGQFIVADSISDEELADLIRQLEIDIVVDLYGFGGLGAEGRPGVARRPAPIQVNYLGHPGTMGADYYDYIIADSTIIPEQHFEFYSEKVVWLPWSFQANDSTRRIAESTPTRSELNLPETGFVFCCFNQSFKIDPTMFDIWMRLLKEVSGSVLWLKVNNATASHNLRLEAERRGVAPERLVFAPSVPLIDDHLARLRQGDLFLDTFHFNAHTTASDALWAGLPVITCLGSTYAGRVAASLNRAVGLPELITTSLEEYEALALKLAREPALLASIKAKLAHNRDTYPLFDTARFTRHIEAAYTRMWERQQSGEPPEGFAVEPID
jgi:protein O-GlcNAc transferase